MCSWEKRSVFLGHMALVVTAFLLSNVCAQQCVLDRVLKDQINSRVKSASPRNANKTCFRPTDGTVDNRIGKSTKLCSKDGRATVDSPTALLCMRTHSFVW